MRQYAFILFVVAVHLLAANLAFAEDMQSNTPAEESGDIDQEITNAKMRADSGSKSKWSVKADITYYGGNLEKPFGPVRPNYAGVSSQDNSTAIAGTVGVAYRFNKKDSVRAGTGLLVLTPFQTVKETDVSNPYLEYTKSLRKGNFQNIFDTSYTWYTQEAYTDAHYRGIFDINHTALWSAPSTNWQPGLTVDFNYTFFGDSKQPSDTLTNPEAGRSDYTIGLYPFVEYAFTDRYSFRTVFRFLTFDHYRYDDPATFVRQLYTQSLGFGIVVTRDIYLYPNMQFAPEHLSPERTNVGLITSFSVF